MASALLAASLALSSACGTGGVPDAGLPDASDARGSTFVPDPPPAESAAALLAQIAPAPLREARRDGHDAARAPIQPRASSSSDADACPAPRAHAARAATRCATDRRRRGCQRVAFVRTLRYR